MGDTPFERNSLNTMNLYLLYAFQKRNAIVPFLKRIITGDEIYIVYIILIEEGLSIIIGTNRTELHKKKMTDYAVSLVGLQRCVF